MLNNLFLIRHYHVVITCASRGVSHLILAGDADREIYKRVFFPFKKADADLYQAEKLFGEQSGLSCYRAAVCGRAGWPDRPPQTPSLGRSSTLTGFPSFLLRSPGR